MVPIGFYEGETSTAIESTLKATQSRLALEAREKGNQVIGNAISGLVDEANRYVDLVANRYDFTVFRSKKDFIPLVEDVIYPFSYNDKVIEIVNIHIGGRDFYCPIVKIARGRAEPVMALPDGSVHGVKLLFSEGDATGEAGAVSVVSLPEGLHRKTYPIVNGIERIKTDDDGMLKFGRGYRLPDDRVVSLSSSRFILSIDGYGLSNNIRADGIDRSVKGIINGLISVEKGLRETRESGGRMPEKATPSEFE